MFYVLKLSVCRSRWHLCSSTIWSSECFNQSLRASVRNGM